MPRRLPCSNLSTKQRIKFVVAYDGYDFCGWAPQAGHRTVHCTLKEAVRQISGEENEIIGASRTDSGAHAKGQVCHFDTELNMPLERWPRVINQLLPLDLSVIDAKRVHPDFHSRFWANSRWYRYRIQTGYRDPRRSRYCWHHPRALDVAAMQSAAQKFVGRHDFLAFSQLVPKGKNTVRELFSVEVRAYRDEVILDIVGTAFIRGMMRRICGSLWEVGRGQRSEENIDLLLGSRDRRKIVWPTLLPARGLTLMKVAYGRHPTEKRRLAVTNEDE